MRRREFVQLAAGAAAVLPHVARAQQKAMPVMGILGASTPAVWHDYVAALAQRLGELGWIDDRTFKIEYRWAEGHTERFASLATELATLKVDVIVTVGSAARAAMKVASATPIVFALDKDPVGSGLVASLAHPGGNVTGLSLQSSDLVAKRLQFLRDVIPGVRRLAIMANVAYTANALEMVEVETTARSLGLEVDALEIRRSEDIETSFAALGSKAQALYLCADAFIGANLKRILALTAHLPTMHTTRDYVVAGGLMSYGPSNTDLFRRAGDYVDKILRGAKPADIPVEQPIKFELVINLKTAKELGLTVPPLLLVQADEVIE